MRIPRERLPQLLAFALAMLPLVLTVFATTANAQKDAVHYFHSSNMPPGAIGRGQLLRGGPLHGYFQPVEITGPKGSLVSLAVNGQFTPPQSNSVLAGMLIGQVYRLRVGNIPDQEGAEVYPTVEVVHRLHPPPGQETRFPIPIAITAEELALAISGRFVTRVIYLENPVNAIGIAETPNSQRYFEVLPSEDPLKVADELGRPMAILRMGSRVPDMNQDNTQLGFQYGSPPAMLYEKQVTVPRNSGLEATPEKALPANGSPETNGAAPASKQASAINATEPRTPSRTRTARPGNFPRLPAANEYAPTIFSVPPQVTR